MGYVRRRWKGELPLWLTFWVYLMLGNFLCQTIFWILMLLTFFRPASDPELTINEEHVLLVVLLIVTLAGPIYSVFTGVAVIRSGRAYVKAHAASLLKRMAGRAAQLLAVWFGFVQALVPLLVLATLFLPALHQ